MVAFRSKAHPDLGHCSLATIGFILTAIAELQLARMARYSPRAAVWLVWHELILCYDTKGLGFMLFDRPVKQDRNSRIHVRF